MFFKKIYIKENLKKRIFLKFVDSFNKINCCLVFFLFFEDFNF